MADSHASSDTDSDIYSNTNANTGCEYDIGTDRFANAINTARSITAWKQAQDKGSTDARHQGCRGTTIPPVWDGYADAGTVGRTSGHCLALKKGSVGSGRESNQNRGLKIIRRGQARRPNLRLLGLFPIEEASDGPHIASSN